MSIPIYALRQYVNGETYYKATDDELQDAIDYAKKKLTKLFNLTGFHSEHWKKLSGFTVKDFRSYLKILTALNLEKEIEELKRMIEERINKLKELK